MVLAKQKAFKEHIYILCPGDSNMLYALFMAVLNTKHTTALLEIASVVFTEVDVKIVLATVEVALLVMVLVDGLDVELVSVVFGWEVLATVDLSVDKLDEDELLSIAVVVVSSPNDVDCNRVVGIALVTSVDDLGTAVDDISDVVLILIVVAVVLSVVVPAVVAAIVVSVIKSNEHALGHVQHWVPKPKPDQKKPTQNLGFSGWFRHDSKNFGLRLGSG